MYDFIGEGFILFRALCDGDGTHHDMRLWSRLGKVTGEQWAGEEGGCSIAQDAASQEVLRVLWVRDTGHTSGAR